MGHHYKTIFLRSSLLIFVAVGMCAQLPGSSHYLSRKDVIREQVQDDILTSLAMNTQAKSEQEWETSGYTPAEIFQSIRALKTSAAWKTACRALLSLKPKELALFEPEFNLPQNAQALTCHGQLVARMRAYWEGEKLALARNAPEAARLAMSDHARWRKTEPASTTADKTVRGPVSAGNIHEILKDGEFALLFDAGPSAGHTWRVLDILKDQDVRAHFMLEGSNVRENTGVMKRLARSGHVLGATTFHHPVLTLLDAKSAQEEIAESRNELSQAIGEPVRFFRVPFENRNDFVDDCLEKQGLVTISPTIDSEDWKTRDPERLLKNIFAKLEHERSGILELHDSLEQTVQVLPELLAGMRARGFTPVVLTPADSSSNVAAR